MWYTIKMKPQSTATARIGIDARFYGPLGKGLGRYTQEIVDRIVSLDTHHEYVIFLGKDNFDEFVPPRPNVKKVLADVRWYTWAEQFVMPRLIKQEGITLMHFPHFNVPVFCPVPFVITIHDLILTKFPTMRATTLGPVIYFIKNLGYRFGISRAVKRARAVIAVSEYTKEDILSQFKIRPEKVRVIYEGVAKLDHAADQAYTAKLEANEILSGYCILEPYLLYVGNAYPHKNLETLVRVFLKLKPLFPDLKLVLVGREDYFYSRLKEFVKSVTSDTNAIIFPGYVPDQDLQTLFSHAAAYVFPSQYEGFGLPPLEAMSRDCPVISSNATCLPEILGEAAVYFNPESETEMTDVIAQVLSTPPLRVELIAKGREQIKRYDWQRAAEDTIKVYNEALV